jgi:hypothetical protein
MIYHVPVRSIWTERAARLLEDARGLVLDGVHDAIPTVDAALTALRIEAGELSPDAMDGCFDNDDEWGYTR